MQMIRINAVIESSAYSAGKQIALYSYGEELLGSISDPIIKNLINTALSDDYCKKLILEKLSSLEISSKLLSKDISLFRSQVKVNGKEDDIVDFAINYKLKPVCNFFGIADYELLNRIRLHPWTGYSYEDIKDKDDSDRIVYITETGTVYHLTKSCSYLDLSISQSSMNTIAELTNASGSHYHPCEKCYKNSSNSELIFITTFGDAYHSSLSCSGLKRTIIAISIKDVGDKKACSRCGGN